MNVLCSAKACPVLLSSTCVFYEGENLIYTGINTNDNLQEALQKIDETIGNTFSTFVPITRTLTINGVTYNLSANRTWNVGTVTSVDMSVPTGLTISGNPITGSGTLALGLASGYSIPTTANQATWTTAYNDSIISAAVTGTNTKTLTLNQQDGGTVTASWSDIDTGLTSVGVSMPAAFAVTNSPLTSNGTIGITGAGLASQYVRGDGALGDFPSTGGGGSSVSYYLNGSVNQGTFGGSTYYEMNRTPIIGGPGVNFSITNTSGLVSQFITDPLDPSLLLIPGGNWNIEFYFNASDSLDDPYFYVELYVYNGTTFTLIASNSTNPEYITNGTSIDVYYTSLAVPETIITVTDRLALRVYGNTDGNRTITLYTEDNTVSQIITTFSNGLTALNGLTKQVQYLATSTTGTDFTISSSIDTHTFNLPTASASNRGALSSADWSTFSGKVGGSGATGQVAYWNGTSSQTGSNNLFWDAANERLGIGTNAPSRKLHVIGASALFQNAGTFELDLLNTTSGNYLRATAGATDANIGTIQNIPFSFIMNGARVGQFTSTNGNLILQNGGTFTDAGYRLDVNGTARVSGAATFSSSVTAIKVLIGDNGFGSQWAVFNHADSTGASNAFVGIDNSNGSQISNIKTNGTFEWRVSNSNVMNLKTSGNLLVGTTTDAGYKLDVNGTARVSGAATFSSSVTATSFIKSGGTSSQYLMADGSVTTGGGGGSVDELQVALISQVYG